MTWTDKRVLVTGGASFIGSHLTDALVERGASVRVADNLSSGTRENLEAHLRSGTIDFQEVDLLEAEAVEAALRDIEIVFHLAADHGGRGYIDTHQVNCSTNLILDGQIFRAAARADVAKVVFASSGCVYPNHLQTNPNEILYLREDMVQPPYDADNMYGWAKLMGELVLGAYCAEGRLKGVSLRYFTAYGPRCPESHGVMAMIARALVKQDPFEVWGTGEQIRNWTHVADIVEATVRTAERVDDSIAINVGTMERTRVADAASEILTYTGQSDVEILFDPTRPTGPYNRVCDTALLRERLDWEPAIPFVDGLRETIDWYFEAHSAAQVAGTFDHLLTEREPGLFE
jgi:nucleoside-diphosphate-sugar epimerase